MVMTLRNQPWKGIVLKVSEFILAVSLAAPAVGAAQNMTIYSDSLVNGWPDWSYSTTRNFANTSPVHSGSDSISATVTSAWGGIQLANLLLRHSRDAGGAWIRGDRRACLTCLRSFCHPFSMKALNY